MYRYFENNLPNWWVYIKNTILCVVITVPKRLRFCHQQPQNTLVFQNLFAFNILKDFHLLNGDFVEF